MKPSLLGRLRVDPTKAQLADWYSVAYSCSTKYRVTNLILLLLDDPVSVIRYLLKYEMYNW